MKKTPQQLEWILAEAERVNAVLVNDYTSLKEKVKNLTSEVVDLKKQNSDLDILAKSQKDDIDRMNLIIEYEREQRFDWEHKNDALVVQVNKLKIAQMSLEDKQASYEQTIKQQTESLRAKDEVLEENRSKIASLEEGLKGLKGTFDDTYRALHEGKAQLELVESERDQYLLKLTTTKEELAAKSETVSELETRLLEHNKLMEMEQTHRCNLETQIDEVQKHNRKLVQQMAELTAKDKATEKTLEEHKMQIEQLERVRDHFTLLLDKEKSSKGSLEQVLAEEEKKRASLEANSQQFKEANEVELVKLRADHQEHELTVQNLKSEIESIRSEVEKKTKSLKDAAHQRTELEEQMSSFQQKHSQFESEKNIVIAELNGSIHKLSAEVNSLKVQLEEELNLSGIRHQEQERELNNKIRTIEEALKKERERARLAEDSVVEIRKKHREDLESIQNATQSSTENGNEETDEELPNSPNGNVEQKLKRYLVEEKLELEKLSHSLSEDRIRYKEELERFDLEKAKLLNEAQQLEELTRDLEEREKEVSRYKAEVQEFKKQVEDMSVQKEEFAIAEKKLKDEMQATEELKTSLETEKKQIEESKQEHEEEKSRLAAEKMNHEQEAKALASELQQIEAEKKILAEEKASIDNELQRLVEQRLEMQQTQQTFEDKESQYLTKVEELSHLLAEERKQKEKLESKFAAGTKSPDSKDGLSFSYFKKKKEPVEIIPLESAPVLGDNLTDEERKLKLYNEYQVLLTEINTTLFQKREQVQDIETTTGTGNYFKKMGLGSLKSSVTKMEDLQGRVKKAFRALDNKTEFSPADEASEHQIIKAFRNELT